MTVTAEDVAREHRAALDSLTREQRVAIDRLARARRMSVFNHRWAQENLAALFAQEAGQRSDPALVIAA